ncbi:alpha/beta hydrolase [Polyangium aurulentum]|uniref:alpha/beta hydrolase n=1 Tax=Polyangium aurulentum TaxID=2567896 RepID=UPI0010AEDE18|nr:alpha/beta hydrolase [Polyangium aurulentum]UQA61684.1 alpha/beta hydrolase [Polyangium aurulentum]
MPSPRLAELTAYLKATPITGTTPAELRASFAASMLVTPAPSEARLEPTACEVPSYFITPPDTDPRRVILYLHGGGYIIGSAETHLELVYRFARASGTRALSVDYRLVPEHPFPACREDALAAYRWLLAQDIAPARIVIAGDSAGGGLTLSTLLGIRDAGLPTPAGGVLFSPWLDFTGSGEAMKTNAGRDPMIDPAFMGMMVSLILQGQDPVKSSPLFEDLRGLPPLLVQAGSAEVLLDDSSRLVEKVKAAGGEATLQVWEDMPHVFQVFPTFLPEANEAIERAGTFVRARLG